MDYFFLQGTCLSKRQWQIFQEYLLDTVGMMPWKELFRECRRDISLGVDLPGMPCCVCFYSTGIVARVPCHTAYINNALLALYPSAEV